MPHSFIYFTIPCAYNYEDMLITSIPISHPKFIIMKQDLKKENSKSSMYLQLIAIKPLSIDFPVHMVVKLLVKTSQIYYKLSHGF